MRFSERFGHKPVRSSIQIDSMDDDLRNSLWNVVHGTFLTREEGYLKNNPNLQHIAYSLQLNFFKKGIDQLSEWQGDFVKYLRKWFFESHWYEVYDFIEYMRTVLKKNSWGPENSNFQRSVQFAEHIDRVLEREKSGYRFVGEQLARIIDEAEIISIENALEIEDRFVGAREHMKSALQLYSSRKDPDYRNSIKEAISAIESAACVIASDRKATLGQALKTIKKRQEIHPGMSEAFEKLYGYTSDSGGIRHAMLDEQTIKDHEALFMLVTCSAFLNYLVKSSQG